jgi:hypothetical protein
MARVERISSVQPVPVERAQITDPSSFRFSFASAETLKQIGGILERLGSHKIEMQDRISVSNINAAMENAQREYQKEILEAPIEEHAAILQKHRNNAIAFAGQQSLTPDTRELVESKLEAWGDFFADSGELATIKALERDALIRVTSDYEKALIEGTSEDIVEAKATLDAQYAISYTPAEAKEMIKKVEERAAIAAGKATVEAAFEESIDMPLNKALEFFVKLKGITEAQRNGLIARRERLEAVTVEARQEEVGRQTLIRLWEDENPPTVDDITEMLASNSITESRAKELRKAILNPEPPTTKLDAYAEVLEAINDVGRGALTKNEALDVVYKNVNSLDPTLGKSLVAQVFAEQNKGSADMKRNGRSLMEDLIRDKDPITGRFTDIVELEAAIEFSASIGKPLVGTDLLIEAMRIGRRKKQQITEDEKLGKPISFTPNKSPYSPDAARLRKKFSEIAEAAKKVVAELGKGEKLIEEFKTIQKSLSPDEAKKLRELWDRAAKDNVTLREFLSRWRKHIGEE